jgi:general secretion pathway protein G
MKMTRDFLKAMQSKTEKKHNQMGMTLVEIMVVIVIVGMIAGVTGVAVIKQLGKAKIQTTKQNVANMENAINLYYAQEGDYPEQGNWNTALEEEGYIKEVKKDEFKQDFIYRNPGVKNADTFDIFSMGPDKAEGTEDDIGNW